MNLTKEDISNLIQHTDKAEAFDSIMKRNIPYEPYQLAMMFMNGRRIGKSFMSYGLVAERCLELLKETKLIQLLPDYLDNRFISDKHKIVLSGYDPDIENTFYRFQNWVRNFKGFLDTYYPELVVDRQEQDKIVKVRYKEDRVNVFEDRETSN